MEELSLKKKVTKGWSQFSERGVFIVLILLVVILSILTPNFRRIGNIINIARQISEISISAIGMTYLIIAAEFDLAVGSVYGLAAIVAAIVLRQGFPVILAFLAALAVGVVVGLINGTVTTKLKVPAFIVTLSMLTIVRGFVYGLSGGYSISIFPESANSFFLLGNSIGGVFPIQIIIMIVLFIIAGVILSKTTFGFKIYATGGIKMQLN